MEAGAPGTPRPARRVLRACGEPRADQGVGVKLVETAIGCHTFRAAGTADYVTNDGPSRSRNTRPGTRTRKRRASITGATTTRALARLSEFGILSVLWRNPDFLTHAAVSGKTQSNTLYTNTEI